MTCEGHDPTTHEVTNRRLRLATLALEQIVVGIEQGSSKDPYDTARRALELNGIHL